MRATTSAETGSSFARNTWDEAKGTIDLTILSAGHRIRRYHYLAGKVVDEVFSFEPGHVRTGRLSKGLPLLYNHSTWDHEDLLGKVEEITFGPSQGMRGTARFSQREDERIKGIKVDVRDNILDGASLGTQVYAYQITMREGDFDEWLAIDHEPLEVSLTPIQADPDSRTQSKDQKPEGEPVVLSITESQKMPEPIPPKTPEQIASEAAAATREMTMRLMSRASSLSLPLEVVESIMAQNLSFEAATDQMIATSTRLRAEAAAAELAVKKPETELPSGRAALNIDVDQANKDATGIIEYLAHKEAPKHFPATEAAKRFMGYTAVDICRYIVESHGVKTMGMPREEIIQRAMTPFRKNDIGGMQTTSDFPNLLGEGLLNRSLVKAYERQPDNYSNLVGETTFSDTRTKNFVQIGNLGPLRKVLQAAEYKRVILQESKEKLNIDKYGEIFALSLEAILNDDLSAFVRLPAAFAQAAKLTEEAIVFGLLVTNPAMLADNVQAMHATHGNVGTPAAPDVTGITDARTLMRRQTGLNAEAGRLGIKPRYIAAPVKYEVGLSQLMGPIRNNATETDQIIPQYIRDMNYVISDVLDEASLQAWYGIADPAIIECIMVSRLQGGRAFTLAQKEGWNVDGMEWKVRHWFGAGIVDYRGLYYNAGVS